MATAFISGRARIESSTRTSTLSAAEGSQWAGRAERQTGRVRVATDRACCAIEQHAGTRVEAISGEGAIWQRKRTFAVGLALHIIIGRRRAVRADDVAVARRVVARELAKLARFARLKLREEAISIRNRGRRRFAQTF